MKADRLTNSPVNDWIRDEVYYLEMFYSQETNLNIVGGGRYMYAEVITVNKDAIEIFLSHTDFMKWKRFVDDMSQLRAVWRKHRW